MTMDLALVIFEISEGGGSSKHPEMGREDTSVFILGFGIFI